MKIEFDDYFSTIDEDEKSAVFQLFPSVFEDSRGYFLEQWKFDEDRKLDGIPYWLFGTQWIKQINTSCSNPHTIRCCHAQSGPMCQAKLVFSQTGGVFDFILDARPNSKSFGKSKIYYLSPSLQNKLFIPRGFLHGFITPNKNESFIFTYFCDNVYSKEHEVCVSPQSIISNEFSKYCKRYGVEDFTKDSNIFVSEKDENGMNLENFLEKVKKMWINVWLK